MFYNKGVVISNDSPRYIEYASNIRMGHFYDDFNIWYFSYAFVLYLFSFFTKGITFIILFQNIVSIIAFVAYLHTSVMLWKNLKVTVVAGLLFILFYELYLWNSYVLTESLYISCICFCMNLLCRIYTGNRKPATVILFLLLILITFFLRPTSICLIGAIAFTTLSKLTSVIPNTLYRSSITLLILIAFAVLANHMLAGYHIITLYQKGEVIAGITSLGGDPKYAPFILTPPTNLPSYPNNYPIVDLISFIFAEPVYFLKLSFTKAFFYIAHVRPYWSFKHNAYCLLLLTLTYAGATKTLINMQEYKTAAQFAVAFVTSNIICISLTFEDWDGRFLLPLLPMLFLLAAKSIFHYGTSMRAKAF